GLCYAVPTLRPGMIVEIDNIGKRFSGKFHVTATTHTFTPAEGYATLFTVSGKRPSTILSLLHGEELSKRAPLGGNVVVGLVTNNKDPDGLGRVKGKYPWLTEDRERLWVRMAPRMAGRDRGLYF